MDPPEESVRLAREKLNSPLSTWRAAAIAYRIQERGELLVERIEGSYSNVMGLPIRIFYGMLMQHEYPFPLSG